ncbi:charged multivesicular body protein 6 [Babesia caballi]|uniref:Charged multivesicular body protein 6 n=1 Tax=Babesia caballi TaxID=5871 RepID=A0AAV4LPJ8_BABCB|nr:charged multivesicular body protein 6 [Babesia caballi]
MGGVASLCGSKSLNVDITSQMVQLKGQRDELEEYRSSLLQRVQELAAETLTRERSGEREKALMCLRKKALLQDQLSKIDNYLYQVLAVISDTEMAQVNLEVYKHLKIGAELLEKLSRVVKFADLEALLATEKRCQENMDEIGSLLGQNLRYLDDAALLQELELLRQEDDSAQPTADTIETPPAPQGTQEALKSVPEAAPFTPPSMEEMQQETPRGDASQRVPVMS